MMGVALMIAMDTGRLREIIGWIEAIDIGGLREIIVPGAVS